MVYIFDFPGPLRFHLYFTTILFFVLGLPTIALFWFIAYYLFFWDEHKHEFLDYDEYLEDCLEMFRIDLDDIERAHRFIDMLQNHYKDKTIPEELIYSSAYEAAGSSDDFEMRRFLKTWDADGIFYILWVLDWIQEDWDYQAETELDETSDFTRADSSFYYHYFYFIREQEKGPSLNKLPVGEPLSYVPQTLLSQNLSKNYFALAKNSSTDLIEFFDDELVDDFRFNFWTERRLRNKKN